MPLSLDKQNAYRAHYAALRPGWRPATEMYRAIIQAHLKPGMSVLDIGCGRGGVLEQLGDTVDQPFGIDPDLTSLVEHRLPDLPRAVAVSDAIPLPAACIDLALSSWVLEHLADPGRSFREVARVLKPGGVFIFLTPGANSPAALLNRVFGPLQSWLVPRLYGRHESDAFPVTYRANTRRQIEKLAHDAGFTLDTFHLIGDPTYFAFHPILFRLNVAFERLRPAFMAEHLVAVCSRPPLAIRR